MKRILTLVLFASLCLGTLSLTAWAANEDYTADTWANAELKGLIAQDGEYIYSELAPDYEAWWWEGEVSELDDDYAIASYINFRGFSMSADGRYAYIGALNGGTVVFENDFAQCAAHLRQQRRWHKPIVGKFHIDFCYFERCVSPLAKLVDDILALR